MYFSVKCGKPKKNPGSFKNPRKTQGPQETQEPKIGSKNPRSWEKTQGVAPLDLNLGLNCTGLLEA